MFNGLATYQNWVTLQAIAENPVVSQQQCKKCNITRQKFSSGDLSVC